MQRDLARKEGIGVEPASAASVAGVKHLVEDGVIDRDERVVCVVTGHLLKDPDTVIRQCEPPTRDRGRRHFAALCTALVVLTLAVAAPAAALDAA